MNSIELSLFVARLEAICHEMGAVLRRSALSPNIRDRLDFSCALFDAEGRLCAQAAHIPVHLGSMAWAMGDIVATWVWHQGEMVVVNDPYLGGTHLPDVTLIAPLFIDGICVAFVVNRAHHANIGGDTPGSMPLSTHLDEEGVVIPLTSLTNNGVLDEARVASLFGDAWSEDLAGDFAAQTSANLAGLNRLTALITPLGIAAWQQAIALLFDYGERLARQTLKQIPAGSYTFTDWLDDDGAGNYDLPITANITLEEGEVSVDFHATALQTRGNVNAPLAVAAAAVIYVLRCLMPPHTPMCAGTLRPIHIRAAAGSLLNPNAPAAVAAGNVETSSRVVDVICGALATAIPELIPAASHGSMNNLAMGSRQAGAAWDYYETIGGGMGAGAVGGGWSAVQTHMTNTLNTPIEVVEQRWPLRIRRYAVRRNSGGHGIRAGGDGLIREFEFLATAEVTLLTERRRHAPWGLAGGGEGSRGENYLNGSPLPAKWYGVLQRGDRLTILTPGGGGWGALQAGAIKSPEWKA
jgi:N-methylhydantoinase B